jgi:hypothetical protein
MKFYVAHDEHGRILAAAQEGSDQPDSMPGVSVTEMEIPAELEEADPEEFFHLLHVDVKQRKLIKRNSSASITPR